MSLVTHFHTGRLDLSPHAHLDLPCLHFKEPQLLTGGNWIAPGRLRPCHSPQLALRERSFVQTLQLWKYSIVTLFMRLCLL